MREVQINKKAYIDFPVVRRAFLQADPNICLLGEPRDKETVSMGVASLSGHVVFLTIHAKSAPESITRLLDMGKDPSNIADVLVSIGLNGLAKRFVTEMNFAC